MAWPRSFLAYINALKDEAGRNIGMVMVIDDLTELEKAQRMVARPPPPLA